MGIWNSLPILTDSNFQMVLNRVHNNGLLQDCSNSIANALGLLQSWTKHPYAAEKMNAKYTVAHKKFWPAKCHHHTHHAECALCWGIHTILCGVFWSLSNSAIHVYYGDWKVAKLSPQNDMVTPPYEYNTDHHIHRAHTITRRTTW